MHYLNDENIDRSETMTLFDTSTKIISLVSVRIAI